MRVKDLDVDIFKGEINTFITLKHKPTKITIARSIPNYWNLTNCMRKLSKEFKKCIEIKIMHGE